MKGREQDGSTTWMCGQHQEIDKESAWQSVLRKQETEQSGANLPWGDDDFF